MKTINIYSTDRNGFETLSNILNGTCTEIVEGRKGKVEVKFLSVEHAYQTKKALHVKNFELANKIYKSKTGWEAQKLSKEIAKNFLVENNFNSALELEKSMRLCFEQNPKQLELLLSTKDAILTHKSSKFNLGKWETVFPNILTRIRDENRNKTIN